MYGILIPVGPGARELERLTTLVEGLRRYQDPAAARLIVIDDSPAARAPAIDWPAVSVLRTPLWNGRRAPAPYDAQVAGTLHGLSEARAHGLQFVLKLDTDAAVIAPFSSTIARALAAPGVGAVGSYDLSYSGQPRDWSLWQRPLRRATRRVAAHGNAGHRRLVWRSRAARAHVRAIIARALAVAPAGAHCLGGAYAVSGALIDRARLDWEPWLGTGLSEDVVVGLLCSELGLRMRSLTAAGEPFALAWQGLPGPPEEIAARGHAIAHSVKCERGADERALVERLWRCSAAAAN
ncbi:MAG: hypothetical protein ACRDMX_13670 [Solirubrobacteraceae bacterium]